VAGLKLLLELPSPSQASCQRGESQRGTLKEAAGDLSTKAAERLVHQPAPATA